MNKKYIVICVSRCEGSSEAFRVGASFETNEQAESAMVDDMREYLASEIEVGYKCKIVGNHIEWDRDDGEREAKWYVYEV